MRISHVLNLRYWVPLLTAAIFLSALAWARNNNPYQQLDFSLQTHGGPVDTTVILPKLAAKYAVVIYAHAHGEDLTTMDATLEQFADLGLAAVGFEYDSTNQTDFDDQFSVLQAHIKQQPWAQGNAIAWVGLSQGAQETFRFILSHPETQPQLLVRISGGWVPELDSGSNALALIHCPVLLVHSENDATFPVEDAKRLAVLLQSNAVPVNLQIIRGHNHSFGKDRATVFRAVAEYCRSKLPPTDYTATLRDCQLNETERKRFNLSMQRAGLNRGELWKAVILSREPERRTIMMVIGGLEDYDLAHFTSSHLREVVHTAWQARRTFPWCKDTPLNIFESVTTNPRLYDEPIEDYQSYFSRRLYREVKYCHTTQEASDAVWKWVQKNVVWASVSSEGMTPIEILNRKEADCLGLVVLYTAACRSVGLPERPTKIVWQNSLEEHFCSEVWSIEDNRWHELDSSADNRPYSTPWILNVPKAMILAPSGDRGIWNALAEDRLDAFTNTIGLVYPSGEVAIKILDHNLPAPGQRVTIQLPTVNGLVSIANTSADAHGEVHLVLGKSAKYPYLVSAETSDNGPWKWLQVHTNQINQVALSLGDQHPFDPKATPPILASQ